MNVEDAKEFDEFLKRNWGMKKEKIAKKWGEN